LIRTGTTKNDGNELVQFGTVNSTICL